MDLSDDIKKLIAAALAAIALSYFGYNFFYKPKIKELRNLEKTLAAIEKEAKGEPLARKTGDQEKIQKEIEAITGKIPGEAEVPYLLEKFISQVGKGLDIEYASIEPQNLIDEKAYKRLPLKLEFTASYLELDYYLRQLKDLPAVFRVDSLTLARKDDSPKLKVNLALSTFLLPGKIKTSPASIATEEAAVYLFDPFSSMEARPRLKEKTAPKAVVKRKAPGPILQGIWLSKNPKAIISDKVVGVGDEIYGYEITAIEKGKVMMVKYGKETILEMRK